MKKIFITTLSALTCVGLLTTNVFATANYSEEMDTYRNQELYVVDEVAHYECGYPIENHFEENNHSTETDDINEKALVCHCGGALSVRIVFTGNWYYTGASRACTDKKMGHDYEEKQQVIRRYSCNKCLDGYELTSYNTNWQCKGFNQ